LVHHDDRGGGGGGRAQGKRNLLDQPGVCLEKQLKNLMEWKRGKQCKNRRETKGKDYVNSGKNHRQTGGTKGSNLQRWL